MSNIRQCKMCDDLKLDQEFWFMEMVCRECYWSKGMSRGCHELRNNEKCDHQDPTKSAPTSDSEHQDKELFSGPNSPCHTPCPTLRSISPDTPVLPVLTGRLSPHHSPVFCSNEMCRVKILAGKTRHPKTGAKWICQICRAYFMTYQKDRVTKEFQAMLDLVVKALASPIFKLPPLPQNSRWTWTEWKNILQKTFPGDFFTKLIVEHRLRNGFNDVPVFEDPDHEAGPAPRMLSPILVPSEVSKERIASEEHQSASAPSYSHCPATVTAPHAPSKPAHQISAKNTLFLKDTLLSKASVFPKELIAYKNAPVPSQPIPEHYIAPVGDEPLPQAPWFSAGNSIFPVECQPAAGRSLSKHPSLVTSIELEDCQESPLDLSSSSAPKNASQAPASSDDSSTKPSPPQAQEACLSATKIFAKPSPPRAASQAIMNQNAVSVIRFAPKCSKPFIESFSSITKPFVKPAPKTSELCIGPVSNITNPFVEPAQKCAKPFIGPAPKSSKRIIEPAPKSSKSFIKPAPKFSKTSVDPASKSSEPFIEPAPKPSKPFIEPAPKFSKTFVKPALKSSQPFIGSAPKSAEPFIGLAPNPSRPYAPAIPSTSAPGTSTTTATINRIQNLVTSIAPPPPPPETLIVPKIYSQIFHVCGNDGICMRPMARRVFVDMETGKKVCYSCIRRKPRSSRQLPVALKRPRMEDDAKN